MFKKGDKVVRINGFHQGMEVGDVGIVESCGASVKLVEYSQPMSIKNFELSTSSATSTKRYTKYTFKASSKRAIRHEEVEKELSEESPLAIIEYQDKLEVVLHSSIVNKMWDCKMSKKDIKDLEYSRFEGLKGPQEIPKVKGLVAKVVKAEWKGSPVEVTVRVFRVL